MTENRIVPLSGVARFDETVGAQSHMLYDMSEHISTMTTNVLQFKKYTPVMRQAGRAQDSSLGHVPAGPAAAMPLQLLVWVEFVGPFSTLAELLDVLHRWLSS